MKGFLPKAIQKRYKSKIHNKSKIQEKNRRAEKNQKVQQLLKKSAENIFSQDEGQSYVMVNLSLFCFLSLFVLRKAAFLCEKKRARDEKIFSLSEKNIIMDCVKHCCFRCGDILIHSGIFYEKRCFL
ncbi:hypothetical protein [Bartonella elizabethae]|uniref:hypothetical protein n=1 Tax=Bartonella elizabethae TaxID=807 RepID=UPI00031A8F7E|nr:hypothetical protein [Bartonella elizabethae]